MAASSTEVWQQGTVIEARRIATDIQRIVLEATLPAKAEPGSHIDVSVSIEGREATRSYSVVESSEDGRRLVLGVLKAPLSKGGSVFMHQLRPGDQLTFTQPLQNFPLRIGAKRYILLAGGVGITAILNMARVLRDLNAEYTLVYAGRSRAAMAYLRELQELHEGNLIAHVDDEGSPLEVRGLISTATPDTELYMCGPIRLMDAVRRAWGERRLAFPNLRYETFGNSGWFDSQEFIVRVPRLDLEVKVHKGESMLEALEDAGADMMFDCRKGECGLCEVSVLELEGTIDHRDVFYSARQKTAANRMACCVSRVASTRSIAEAEPISSFPAVVTIDAS